MKLTENIKNILKNSKKDTEWINEEKERISLRQDSKKAGLVATQLAYFMSKNKISQTKLGLKIGVSPQQISKILKGKENLTLSTIEKIENALEIELLIVNNLEKKPQANPISLPKISHQPIKSIFSTIYCISNKDTNAPKTNINDLNISNEYNISIFDVDYYEVMKQRAIKRAHERFEKLKSGSSANIQQWSIVLGSPSTKMKETEIEEIWETSEKLELNEI